MKKAKRIIALLCVVVLAVQFIIIPAQADSYPQLKMGDKGDYVKKLQKLLNLIDDANLKVDGIFGTKTDNAVRAFQKFFRLKKVDGIVGPETWAKLLELEKVAKPVSLSLSSYKGPKEGRTYDNHNDDLKINIGGKIKSSGCPIVGVDIWVEYGNGTHSSEEVNKSFSVNQNIKSFDISTVNKDIVFGNLEYGTCRYIVEVTVWNGARIIWRRLKDVTFYLDF